MYQQHMLVKLRKPILKYTLNKYHVLCLYSLKHISIANCLCLHDSFITKLSKGAKIRNRYNQVPHLTHDTNEKVTNSQLDTTNENQEVRSFQAGDHKAQINRRALCFC